MVDNDNFKRRDDTGTGASTLLRLARGARTSPVRPLEGSQPKLSRSFFFLLALVNTSLLPHCRGRGHVEPEALVVIAAAPHRSSVEHAGMGTA